jgi:hypothetical protein
MRLEGGGNVVGVSLRSQPLIVEDARQEIVREHLLEVQLGVGVDLVAGVEQPVGETVDRSAHSNLQAFDVIHVLSIGGADDRWCCPCRRP